MSLYSEHPKFLNPVHSSIHLSKPFGRALGADGQVAWKKKRVEVLASGMRVARPDNAFLFWSFPCSRKVRIKGV